MLKSECPEYPPPREEPEYEADGRDPAGKLLGEKDD